MESRSNFNDLTAHLRMLLKSACYSDTTIRDMEFILQAFASYMEANALTEYTTETGKLLISYCDQELHVCESRITRAKVIVAKLNRLWQGLDGTAALWGDRAVIPELSANLMNALEAFSSYCQDNGNKDATLHYKRWICGRFLKNLADLGCEDTADLTGELVQSAFIQLGYPRYWERIGPFLCFLFEHDLARYNYSKLVLNRRKHAVYPTVYSPAEISVMESSLDRSTPSGIRNYAIVLLLSRYGIRACDVAALSFENLDFVNNRIHFIQQKTGDPWESELFPEVQAALEDYIQNVRPEVLGCSTVFMTMGIPYKPLNSFAINTAVWTLVGKSDVATEGKKHGSRAFRSSIASNMMNDQVPSEVVRRVLGHGTKHAIKHYTKIDIESMRLCPLAVPEPSGAFAKKLSWKAGGNHV